MIPTMNTIIWDAIALLNVIMFCVVIVLSFKMYPKLDNIIRKLNIQQDYAHIIKMAFCGLFIFCALFFFGIIAYFDTIQNHLEQISTDLHKIVQQLPATP